MISDIVYDGPQFENCEMLWDAVLNAVERIKKKATILKLYSGYNKRLIAVIKAQGAEINY